MPCTEAYKEHIMYTFNGFCKVVIHNAAITAWCDQHRRHKREISLEYLTEEKFYPLGTTDEYFEAPYEEYPITICGPTVILTNGELATALLSLPERNREIIFLYFFGDYTQREIGEMYGRCRSTTGYQIRRTLQLLHKEMEVLSHGESESFAL
ncbi:sigma-70 family RNA polymerase sigma factor [Lachnospiraceae bacterium 64-25]